MRRFPDLPIKQKLTLISLLATAVALVLAAAGLVTYELGTFKKELVDDVASIADIIGYNAVAALSFNDTASAAETLKALDAKPHIVAACIYDRSGRVFATYPHAQPAADFSPPPAGPTEHFGSDQLDLFRPILVAGENTGTIYLRADLEGIRAQLGRFALILGGVMLVSMLVAYWIAARLQRVISDPVAELVAITNRVAAEKDYALRAVKRGDDELGRLMDGFNEMLAQIQSRDGALQMAHQDLERRVEERTAELRKENAERKRAEEDLRAKTALLEAQMNASIDGILVVNRAGEKINQNRRLIDLMKIPGDIISERDDRTQLQFFVKQMKYPDKFVERVDYLYAHPGESSREEIEMQDGRVLDRYTAPVIGKDGEIYGRIWGFRDITERKRAEETLRDSEERFAGAFEHAPIGVALVSPDGHWLRVNRSICGLVGYTEAELLAVTFQDITYPEDLAADLDFARRLLAGEIRSYEIEKRYVHKLGHLITVLLNVSLVRDGRDQPRYFIAQIQDISARKQSEIDLQKAHTELVEVSRQAGMAEIATGVLHNVGNVLNSVNVSATLVADHVRHTKAGNVSKLAALFAEHKADLPAFLTDDPRGRMIPDYLGTLSESLTVEHAAILRELDHLRTNIDHIKDIVTMQQTYARASGVTETVSVTAMIEDALRINADSLTNHGVTLIRNYQICPSVMTDKHKVMQILINLVRNAKQACKESGRSGKIVAVSATSRDDRVKIAITDNGVGIPAENLTRIFSHGFTTRKEGHGFGLHSAALAARELGGSLTVRSDGPGLGATFVLELPCLPPPHDHANSVR